MTDSSLNLATLISRETLKKSLSSVLIAFILLFLVAIFYVVNQNDKSHQQDINRLTQQLDRTLSNIQQQIENLATNDLIINSIVDYSNRDNYLPIFFRSLKLNNSSNTSIAFTDYTGEVITAKNLPLHQEYASQFQWQDQVLNQGLPFFEYSARGLFVATPVLLSESAEGAIVSYIAKIDELIQLSTNHSTLIYLNSDNEVLYSSNTKLLNDGETFNARKFIFWSIKKQAYLSGEIISLTSPFNAYSKIIWLALIIMISLVSLFLGLMANVRRTAKYASDELKKLHRTLATATTQNAQDVEVHASQNDPIEFIAIRKEFNTVLKNLFDQNISLEKFTSVINSLGEILVVLDTQHQLLLSNHSFEQFCQQANLLIPNDLVNIFPKKHLNADTLKINFEIEYPLVSPLDKAITIQWNASHYVDDKDNVIGFIFAGKDITFAKQLESELQIKNQAIDSAQTSIVITDATQAKQPIIYANKAFYHLTGFSPSEVIGENCRFLQGPNTEAEQVDAIRSAISKQQAITATITNYKKDGSEFFNELTLSPITNEYGFTTHFLGIQLDVTEREATENYLRLAKQKAEESTQLKSEFLASMSHEIRTPMNGVIGLLDILNKEQLSNEQHHHVEIAKSSAYSLLTIINDILDFSKIESGKLDIDHSEFDLVSLFSEVCKTQAQQAHEKNIELVLDLTQMKVALVCGDAVRIRQTINNLLSNAIKFTEHGHVSVSASLMKQQGKQVQLHCQIVDTGIGISHDRLTHVFDSFTQADSSTTRLYGGTGLGLAISQQLCKLMGGEIKVTSEESIGSQFTFTVQLEMAKNEEQSPAVELNSRHILILDKQISSAEALKKQLQAWGANVVIESNIDDLPCYLNSNDFSVVFIDTEFSGGNALDLVRNLPTHIKEELAFVSMNKVNENQNQALLLEIGFKHYFTKPATLRALKQVLEDVLNKALPTINKIKNESTIQQNSIIAKLPILLVEDNRTNQLVAKKILSELGGEITIANHGEEAIAILNNTDTEFRLIFMDCQMPVLDGYQATEQIRAGAAGEQNQHIPIIAMTANAMKGDREKCLLHGMNDYVSKPISIDVLRDKITYWQSSDIQIPQVID